jgi:hypothetical protein
MFASVMSMPERIGIAARPGGLDLESLLRNIVEVVSSGFRESRCWRGPTS